MEWATGLHEIKAPNSGSTVRESDLAAEKLMAHEYDSLRLMKLQYFGHLMQRANSLEKNPDAEKDWGQEKEVIEDEIGWMASPTQWTWVWANSRT